MKVWIGSIIVVVLLIIGLWLLLSPSFSNIGGAAQKMKEKIKGEEHGERDEH
ncbi:MAG: hypothetical protein ACI4XL_03965 [Bacillus sp. (in: firmicutes)]